MSTEEMARRYFAAWNNHNADTMLACFTDDGKYSDPNVPDGISGQALESYATSLFDAFPDLNFEETNLMVAGHKSVTVEWNMTGTQTGAFRGLPPSGCKFSIPGVDVIEAGSDGIKSVRGYFGSASMMEQLGLQVLVQPKQIGPVRFGGSTYTSIGNNAKPEVIGVTQINLGGPERIDELRGHTRSILIEICKMPGFISSQTSVTADGHGITLTAWESMEAAKAATSASAHTAAMKAFNQQNGLGVSAWTSFWTTAKINHRLKRCDSCGRMSTVSDDLMCSACDASLGEEPPFF